MKKRKSRKSSIVISAVLIAALLIASAVGCGPTTGQQNVSAAETGGEAAVLDPAEGSDLPADGGTEVLPDAASGYSTKESLEHAPKGSTGFVLEAAPGGSTGSASEAAAEAGTDADALDSTPGHSTKESLEQAPKGSTGPASEAAPGGSTETAAEYATEIAAESVTEQAAEPDSDRAVKKLIKKYVKSMSLEDKVSGLFIITPEALTGYGGVTEAGEVTRQALEATPVAGLIYFSGNIESRDQLSRMLENTEEWGSINLHPETSEESISGKESAGEAAADEGETGNAETAAADAEETVNAETAAADAGETGNAETAAADAGETGNAEAAAADAGETGNAETAAAGAEETVNAETAAVDAGETGNSEKSRDAGEMIHIPIFLASDEEGGLVARIEDSGIGVPYVEPMGQVGASGDPEAAFEAGSTIGGYLHELGINLDFAPDADVLIDPYNQTIGNRSFGTDPYLCGQMVGRFIDGLHDQGVASCIKHFPGLGDTESDTHTGEAWSSRTIEDYRGAEFLSFLGGIEAGTDMVMVSHLSNTALTGSDLPASLNKVVMTDLLRDELKYEGVIITDSLQMGAVTERFDSAEAAVTAFEAGADILLMPVDFQAARQGILDAVDSGRISEKRIDESLRRILMSRYRTGARRPAEQESEE